MRNAIRSSLMRIEKMSFDFAAGDQGYLVEPDNTKHSVLTIEWTNTRGDAEGLQVYSGGVEGQEEKVLTFLRSYLEAQGIQEIGVDWYWEELGIRWDLVTEEPIVTKTGPNGATHPTVQITVRKAVELENSVDVTQTGYEL